MDGKRRSPRIPPRPAVHWYSAVAATMLVLLATPAMSECRRVPPDATFAGRLDVLKAHCVGDPPVPAGLAQRILAADQRWFRPADWNCYRAARSDYVRQVNSFLATLAHDKVQVQCLANRAQVLDYMLTRVLQDPTLLQGRQ